nr:MAG TPA: hypothetical protein [Caudoviricetes sp.]
MVNVNRIIFHLTQYKLDVCLGCKLNFIDKER